MNGRNPTFVSDLEKERILTIANFASAVTAAYSGYDANVAIQNSATTVLNNSFKDKAIEKLEVARKFLDEKSQKALDDLVAAYKKGDIELAKKYKSQLDDAIESWATSGQYEILGVNAKAAVGAAVFAVGELFIPTNIVDVVPVGKLTKAGKLLKLEEAATKGVKDIVLKDGYYFADGMKISEKYYNDLWTKGRPAPFIQAREILNSNPKVMTDPRAKPGFLRYVANGLELVYNPTTKEIWHIQPEKK